MSEEISFSIMILVFELTAIPNSIAIFTRNLFYSNLIRFGFRLMVAFTYRKRWKHLPTELSG